MRYLGFMSLALLIKYRKQDLFILHFNKLKINNYTNLTMPTEIKYKFPQFWQESDRQIDDLFRSEYQCGKQYRRQVQTSWIFPINLKVVCNRILLARTS